MNPVAEIWRADSAGRVVGGRIFSAADVNPYRNANEGDVEFIAHVREDLPALLGYAEELGVATPGEQILAISARVAAATAGPWRSCACDEYDDHDEGCENAYLAPVVRLSWKHTGAAVYSSVVMSPDSDSAEADLAFIAHAPHDVASLLAGIDAQTPRLA